MSAQRKTTKQDGRKIPKERLEAIRTQSIKRVLAGESPEQVIRETGLHRSRIYAWLKRYHQEGREGLKSKSIPGRPTTKRSSQKTSTTAHQIRKKTEQEKAPPAKNRIDEWALIISESLLNIDQPLSSFLSMLGKSLDGVALITPDLSTPTSPLRPILPPDGYGLANLITINKRLKSNWLANPFLPALDKTNKARTLTELLPKEQWSSNEYIKHTGVESTGDIIGFSFNGPGDSLCGLFVFRYKNSRTFGARTKQFLYRLQPHLESAMKHLVRHWTGAFTARTLAEVTDHLDIAALILNGNGEVTTHSSAAGEMLKEQKYLKKDGLRLNFLYKDNQQEFIQALEKCIAWRQAPINNKPVEAMRFEYPTGDWLGVLVQPITPLSFDIPHSTVISPHVVVYISDPNKPRANPQHQLIMRLFQLATREAQLTTLLTSNHSLEEAANMMDITQATARTYLQHIYEKVGVNKRQDLIQRITKSVALLV